MNYIKILILKNISFQFKSCDIEKIHHQKQDYTILEDLTAKIRNC